MVFRSIRGHATSRPQQPPPDLLKMTCAVDNNKKNQQQQQSTSSLQQHQQHDSGLVWPSSTSVVCCTSINSNVVTSSLSLLSSSLSPHSSPSHQQLLYQQHPNSHNMSALPNPSLSLVSNHYHSSSSLVPPQSPSRLLVHQTSAPDDITISNIYCSTNITRRRGSFTNSVHNLTNSCHNSVSAATLARHSANIVNNVLTNSNATNNSIVHQQLIVHKPPSSPFLQHQFRTPLTPPLYHKPPIPQKPPLTPPLAQRASSGLHGHYSSNGLLQYPTLLQRSPAALQQTNTQHSSGIVQRAPVVQLGGVLANGVLHGPVRTLNRSYTTRASAVRFMMGPTSTL